MKLLSIQEAIAIMNESIAVPPTHKLIRSGIYRNAEREQPPYYKIELEWNKKGEPELDEDGLVNRHVIRAEFDAITGRIVAYCRHDHRRDAEKREREMDAALYEAVYPHVLRWINRLRLQIVPGELQLHKKCIYNGRLYELYYGRQHNGIPFSSYQSFHIHLNERFELIHLYCRWDDCTFADSGNRIPPETFKRRFDSDMLSFLSLSQSILFMFAGKTPSMPQTANGSIRNGKNGLKG